MPKDRDVRKLKGKKERLEKAKSAEVDSCIFAVESDGKKKRRKRDREQGSAFVTDGEEASGDGQAKIDDVIINGLDHVEDASKSSRKNKKKSRNLSSSNQGQKLKQEGIEVVDDDVLYMSSGDEDSSTGMKKWLTEYQDQRPGFEKLQQRIDDFIVAHEERLEQERKEREARIAEDGWTVVEHHKGRKKTTDTESGIAVGSVAPAAVLDKMSKKKQKGVGLDFYRFQKREAQRNQVIMLQSKFEEDKKRIQQLRAARKFRPY